MNTQKFDAVILAGHKQDAVEVPFNPATIWADAAKPLWPGRRGHAVRCLLNGHAFDSVVVARSRKFWLLIPAEIESVAKVSKGDKVQLALAPASA